MQLIGTQLKMEQAKQNVIKASLLEEEILSNVDKNKLLVEYERSLAVLEDSLQTEKLRQEEEFKKRLAERGAQKRSSLNRKHEQELAERALLEKQEKERNELEAKQTAENRALEEETQKELVTVKKELQTNSNEVHDFLMWHLSLIR
eukprot:GILK01020727.1.p3 GENE.GILK01020727.1~~GILK01020727.1.p3  ORF type:complete len:147 (+),score=48.28 GILK01020727.1:147-587(+)